MKKPTHTKPKKKTSLHRKAAPSPDRISPLDDPLSVGNPEVEPELAGENFEIAGREEEAASTGHRVEPVKIDPEENNAETLIEEGLHGYLHVSNKTNRPN
jgi:hypothetical protein